MKRTAAAFVTAFAITIRLRPVKCRRHSQLRLPAMHGMVG